MTDVILAAVLVFPLLCSYFLKSKGDIAFFSVCAGFVLVELASADIGNLLHRNNINNISTDSTNLILIFAPLLLTLLLARGKKDGQFSKLLGWIAALCTGALAVIVAGPFFGTILPSSIADSTVWNDLHKIQSWIISIGVMVSLLMVWSGGVKVRGKKK